MGASTQLRILLVEDDDTARTSLGRVLSRAGYAVHAVPDGEHAVAVLDAAGADFDVVLTDLLLGALDGVAVLKRARALGDPPEVILLTGYGTLQTAIESLRLGAFDYLLKPCKPEELLRCIGNAAERRTGRPLPTAQQ
jgi:DNA-binding response OmpR family regulator